MTTSYLQVQTYQQRMESELIQSLVRWTQKITESSFPQPFSNADFINCFRFLLLEIDPLSFQELQDESTKMSDIIAQISSYHSSNLKSPLPSSRIPTKLQSMTPNKISQIFQLIFDIAFKVDHSKYVVQILNLKQADQEILMSFVDTLMKQEPEISEQTNKDQIKRLLEELERKQFECKLNKQKNDELQQTVYDLKERVIVLKDQNDKISDELNQIQSDKTQLLIELGLHQYDYSYQDIAKRYKQQIRHYQSKLEDLQHFIDSKNSQIEESSSEIELLKQSIGSKKEMQAQKNFKNQEYSKILDKNNEQLQTLKRQLEILNQQITAKNDRLKDLTKDKAEYQEEIKQCKLKILGSEKPIAKYDQMKKLFKKFIVQVKPHMI